MDDRGNGILVGGLCPGLGSESAPPALTLAGVVMGWLSRAAPSLPFVALALLDPLRVRSRSDGTQPHDAGRYAGQCVALILSLIEGLPCPTIGHSHRQSDAGNWAEARSGRA